MPVQSHHHGHHDDKRNDKRCGHANQQDIEHPLAEYAIRIGKTVPGFVVRTYDMCGVAVVQIIHL